MTSRQETCVCVGLFGTVAAGVVAAYFFPPTIVAIIAGVVFAGLLCLYASNA